MKNDCKVSNLREMTELSKPSKGIWLYNKMEAFSFPDPFIRL